MRRCLNYILFPARTPAYPPARETVIEGTPDTTYNMSGMCRGCWTGEMDESDLRSLSRLPVLLGRCHVLVNSNNEQNVGNKHKN